MHTFSTNHPPFLWFAPQVDVRDAGVQYEGAEVPASGAGCASLWFPVLSKSHGGRGGKHLPGPGTHTRAHKGIGTRVFTPCRIDFDTCYIRKKHWNNNSNCLNQRRSTELLRDILTCRSRKKIAVVLNNNCLPFRWTISRALHMTFTYTTIYSQCWWLFVLIYIVKVPIVMLHMVALLISRCSDIWFPTQSSLWSALEDIAKYGDIYPRQHLSFGSFFTLSIFVF